jgi:diaminopimelate dehydrogenase
MGKIAIIGYGNTGRASYEAVTASPDMTVAGVVLRNKATAAAKGVPEGVTVVEDIAELGKVDAAILCTPSREMPGVATKLLKRGINTVDSYDFHPDIYERKTELDAVARANGAVAVIASGWDPGSDSVIRALFEAAAPRGITTTNFGPGMSMGHSVVAASVPGVKKALSITVPKGSGLHRRMVYIEMEDASRFEEAKAAIIADSYFSHDETHVTLTDDADALTDRGSGVHLTRKGASGVTDNQLFSFNMTINNPALTGQLLAASARAALRQSPGCYTLIEIPVIDLLPGEREKLIRRLV